jgi:NADPH:quinone reductase-like Zn-dependent oxidoreductase
MAFRALRVFGEGALAAPRLVEMERGDLSPGAVVVRVQWSGVNYKDALALTGRGRILKRFPLNAGIDAAGLVESSEDPRSRPGDPVSLVHQVAADRRAAADLFAGDGLLAILDAVQEVAQWFLLSYSLTFASFRNSRSAICTWAAQEVSSSFLFAAGVGGDHLVAAFERELAAVHLDSPSVP